MIIAEQGETAEPIRIHSFGATGSRRLRATGDVDYISAARPPGALEPVLNMHPLRGLALGQALIAVAGESAGFEPVQRQVA